ncbi:MAG: HAD-IIA family hydrolase [Phototrophicaceae bacterium]
MKFETIKAVICDMDGVLWRGKTLLNGFKAFFELLHDAQLPFALATNNSSKTPEQYVELIRGYGVEWLTPQHIITSGVATVAMLQRDLPLHAPIHVMGSSSLQAMFADAGFELVNHGAQAVVVGLKRDLTYDDLTIALRCVLGGARLIGTNHDATFPSEDGLMPGNGSIVATIERASGQTAHFVGKPYAPMYEIALDRLQTAPHETLMIGDRLDTDIEGAQRHALKTALVLSGVTQPDDLITSDIQPDVAYEHLGALVTAWNYTGGKRKR